MTVMYNLPLFPLNTVLFPGTPIFLHIFEERYKEMIGLCIDQERPFGVVMIEEGSEVGVPAKPARVGCSAQIVQVETLQDGRMNIAAVGGERFEIVSTDESQAYLQGMVRSLPMVQTSSLESLLTIGRQLRPFITRYTDVLRGIVDIDVGNDDLPDDPVSMGYFAAWILQIPPAGKQALLASYRASEFLETLHHTYRQEIVLVRQMIAQARLENNNEASSLFSLN